MHQMKLNMQIYNYLHIKDVNKMEEIQYFEHVQQGISLFITIYSSHPHSSHKSNLELKLSACCSAQFSSQCMFSSFSSFISAVQCLLIPSSRLNPKMTDHGKSRVLLYILDNDPRREDIGT